MKHLLYEALVVTVIGFGVVLCFLIITGYLTYEVLPELSY
jgi:Na+-transporting methylmalonyl-CoA/oxaloacetate decarboxylase gamma subunit